jgi:hypothetical protein
VDSGDTRDPGRLDDGANRRGDTEQAQATERGGSHQDADRPQRGPDGDRPVISLGLLVTPALDPEQVKMLAADVERELAIRYPDVRWAVTAQRTALVNAPTPLAEIVDAVRSRLLEESWDLVVHVTELPLRIAGRPVLTHSSRTHSAALVSLPALGLRQSSRHLVESVADAVGVFAGDSPEDRKDDHARHGRLVRQRLIELATDVEDADTLEGVTLLHRVASGNLRLVIGMVRANHPWRLVARLSRALIGVVGVAAFAITSSDVWRIAVTVSPFRLGLLCVITMATAVVTLIAVHGLWERAADRRVREQAILFNLVTVITVAFGILALYAAVCVLTLLAAGVLIEPSLLTKQISRPAGFGDYLRLALLASAMATVGGALGGALESDAAVREAAYARRDD